MPYAGQVDKTMGADTVGHLKLLLETELKRAREESNLDIAMFLGVDGRIFSSSIPNQLAPREYRLLNLLKGSLAHICNQLSGQNMMMSVQQFEAGTIIISGVGDRAFLVFLTSKPVEITKMQTVLANVVKTSIVVRHLFESKPITPEVLASYDEAVAGELKRLTRILFVEKFGETKEFKKNKEIAQYLQSKLGPLVGPGPLQEIVTMAYNEVGTTAPYMTSAHWERFLTILLDRLREIEGDSVAAKAEKEWRAHLKQILSSFVLCPCSEVFDDRRCPRLSDRGHDREGRGRGRGRVLAAGWRQPRGADGQGGVPRLDLLQCRGPGGSDGLQHRGGSHAAHGHGDHGRRRRRRRVPVRDAPVLLHTHDLPDALRRRTDEPRGPGRHGRVQRERPQHRRLQFLRLPRTVPGGDREEPRRRDAPRGICILVRVRRRRPRQPVHPVDVRGSPAGDGTLHVDLALSLRARVARVREAGRFVRARPSGGRGVLQPQGPTDRGDLGPHRPAHVPAGRCRPHPRGRRRRPVRAGRGRLGRRDGPAPGRTEARIPPEAGGDHPHEARDAPPEPLRRVAPGAGVVRPDRAAAPRSSGTGPVGTRQSRSGPSIPCSVPASPCRRAARWRLRREPNRSRRSRPSPLRHGRCGSPPAIRPGGS